MYFRAHLEVDPDDAKAISRVKPSKMFGRLLSTMTFGASEEKLEQEAFSAISILQLLNMSLRLIGVDNLIRLSVNDQDFYYDEMGVEKDMENAIRDVEIKMTPIDSGSFQSVSVALEHHTDDIVYVLDINVKRIHKKGELPIQIRVNGLLNGLKKERGEGREGMLRRLRPMFRSQEAHDGLLITRFTAFQDFVESLVQAIGRFIKVKELRQNVTPVIIRPATPITSSHLLKPQKESDPIFHGYHGFADTAFYIYLWASICHEKQIRYKNILLVDIEGKPILQVEEKGINAGSSNTINDYGKFEPPVEGDSVSYFKENLFAAELMALGVFSGAVLLDNLSTTTTTFQNSGEGSSNHDGDSDGDGDGGCSACGGCGG